MILDVIKQSVKSPRVLIPIEELFRDAEGSRMPDVQPARLTTTIAERIVTACPTGALTIENSEPGSFLALDYGDCIGCGQCYAPGDGALVPALRCSVVGQDETTLYDAWDLKQWEGTDRKYEHLARQGG